MTVSDATLCHDSEPPDSAGALGPVRSSLTVLAAPATAGDHAELLPEVSVLRSCTMVVPSAATTADAPVIVADQVTPPSVDVRYW